MILQALCDYYQRQQDKLPPFGFEEKPIPFIVVIDGQGQFVNLEDNRDRVNGKPVAKIERVPKASVRSGAKSYETAHLLWDHFGYTLAQPKIAKLSKNDTEKAVEETKQKAIDDANKQHQSFKTLVNRVQQEIPYDAGVEAVKKFLDSPEGISKVKNHDAWQECLKINGCNFAFRLSSQPHLVCQSADVIDWVVKQPLSEKDVQDGFCLVTGEPRKVVRLHDAVSGVAQKPAPMAAINEPAYTSFGKDKGYNFPVSADSAFRYATALNHLLRKDSPSRFRLGDTSYVCWGERDNALESDFASLFSDASDDPEATARVVKGLFDSIHNGAYRGGKWSRSIFCVGLGT